MISKYYSLIEIMDEKFVKEIKTHKKKIQLKNIFKDQLAPSNKIPDSIETYYDMFSVPDKEKAKILLDNKIKYVYAIIDYPLSTCAMIKFTCYTSVTYGMLLYFYTIAYQLVYEIENNDVDHSTGYIEGMFNRKKSTGRFGIWGHDIEELVYNGYSHIFTLENISDSIFCHFDCDS
jgi:hypothetical protein